ncbi:hypothetical protein HAX54_012499, partial [Datura stramonium]|nr:hypothetical protein [Datura stramonium]
RTIHAGEGSKEERVSMSMSEQVEGGRGQAALRAAPQTSLRCMEWRAAPQIP